MIRIRIEKRDLNDGETYHVCPCVYLCNALAIFTVTNHNKLIAKVKNEKVITVWS